MSLKINIDVDNTINNFLESFLKLLNSVGIRDISYKDIKDYSLEKSTGIPHKTLETLFFRNNAFYQTLKPLENCVETIKELVECDNDVRFVTSIYYDVVQSRIDFIRKYFPFIDTDTQLIITHDKESIYADIIIEDCLNNLKNVNKDCHYIVFSQPWNVDTLPAIGYPVATECKDWYAVHSILRCLGAMKPQKGAVHIYE